MNDPHVLFKTQYGSKLYGLAHALSDDDFYVVTSARAKGHQGKVDGIDTLAVGFGRFVELAASGSQQALEAMFSQEPIVDEISAFRASFHATGPAVYDMYMSRVRAFSQASEMKLRRHAIRTAYNLQDLRRYGRFNPRLSETQVHAANEYTNAGEQGDRRYFDFLRSLTARRLD